MATELRYPSFNARTESEQQIKNYLRQLIDQLQFALNTVGATSTTVVKHISQNQQQTASINKGAADALLSLVPTLPIPRGQVDETWNPDNLDGGVYVIPEDIGIQSGGNTILGNGVLIQMIGTVGGNVDDVKVQIALPVDENRNPMYRICWYNNWSAWRSMKL